MQEVSNVIIDSDSSEVQPAGEGKAAVFLIRNEGENLVDFGNLDRKMTVLAGMAGTALGFIIWAWYSMGGSLPVR